LVLYKHSGQTYRPYDGGPYDELAIMADSDVPYLCYIFAHLRICAFVLPTANKNTWKTTKNTEDTIQWQLFPNVLL
jgi:hypothetical protein